MAVFSGHDCALVPYDRYACDHLEEQLFPTESLGAHYLVARTPPASDEPDLLRVVATRDGTTVQFAPAGAHDPVTLAHAGDVVEFEQRTHLEVTATQPVLVAQFLVGANYDPTNTGALRGDPDLVLAVPVEQFRNRYDFVAEDGFPDGTAIVFAPHGERLLYDGREVSAPPVGAVGSWDVFYLDAYAGAHHLAAFHPGTTIGLIVSGLADYTSYTYPGGLGLAPISPPL